MADSSLLTTWGMTNVGREAMGLGVFQEVIMYYEGLRAAGKLGDFKVGIAELGNMTSASGYMVAEGSREQIQAILADEAFKRLLAKATHVVPFAMTLCATGTGVPQAVERLLGVRKELGI